MDLLHRLVDDWIWISLHVARFVSADSIISPKLASET